MASDCKRVKLPFDKGGSWGDVEIALQRARVEFVNQKCSTAFEELSIARKRSGSSAPSDAYRGLADFISHCTSAEERKTYTSRTLPFIIDRALAMKTCKPANGLPYSFPNVGGEYKLSWDFVTSLVASAFLCILPARDASDSEYFNTNGYHHLFESLLKASSRQGEAAVQAKLRMILNFFDCLATRECRDTANNGRGATSASVSDDSEAAAVENCIIYKRVVHSTKYNFDWWRSLAKPLCPFTVTSTNSKIEDFPDCMQVDFANKFIGGGTLYSGLVQEEIMFCASPQLQAAMFFMAKMSSNEAIQIHNFERFSNYTGYGKSLHFAGSSGDRSKLHVTAIDAKPYIDKKARQYDEDCILRDLNKAYVGFTQIDGADPKGPTNLLPIATGNWGCGVFGGDPQLKAMLQWAAASAASAPCLNYCTFGLSSLSELERVSRYVLERRITVSTLVKTLVRQCVKISKHGKTERTPPSLFSLLREAL